MPIRYLKKKKNLIECFFYTPCLLTVLPVAGSVPSDETEALKAEITKAVEKVQEAGKAARKLLNEDKLHF